MTLEMEIRQREQKALKRGIEQGIEQGTASMLEIIRQIRSGKSREELITEGVDARVVDQALEALS